MSADFSASSLSTKFSMDIASDLHKRDIEIVNNDIETLYNSNHHLPNPVGLKEHLKEHVTECRKRCISRVKIIWAFISFLLSVADVTVIIYLSYLHFHHSQDLMAWLMLMPIVLNFIGIFTFLSK